MNICLSKGLIPWLAAIFASVAVAAPVVEPITWHSGSGPEIKSDVDSASASAPRGNALSALADADAGALNLPAPRMFLHKGMRDDLAWMESLAPSRQRVKVRAVVEHGFPFLYPAYHWLPNGIREHEAFLSNKPEWHDIEALVKLSGACIFCDDHSTFDIVGLLGLLNVKVFYALETTPSTCCLPDAVLTLELSVDERHAREIRLPMVQTERGVYYVADPISHVDTIMSEVASFSERPLMTVTGLVGTGYAPRSRSNSIDYAVRWGSIELEYGSHYAGDPEGVVR